MPNCSICYEPFASPVSLPCGHVFCRECIRQAVDSVKTSRILHSCPTCRRPYSALTVDPALIPPYLQPHILPSIRQVFLEGGPTTPPAASTSASGSITSSSAASAPAAASASSAPVPTPSTSQTELACDLSELHTLRAHCAFWQRRAQIHAAANTNLLALARTVKGCALRLRSERDAARTRCALLKRALPDDVQDLRTSDAADAEADRRLACRDVAARGAGGAGLPVYLMQGLGRPISHFYDNPQDVESSRFGPPMKRRRVATTSDECTRGAADVATGAASASIPASARAASSAPVSEPIPLPVSFPVPDARSSSLPHDAAPNPLALGNVADSFP